LIANEQLTVRNNNGDSVDTFDVRGSLRSIIDATRRYKHVVFLTCAFTLALVTLYVCTWPPIYKAEATVMAEKDSDAARDSFYVGWDIFRKDDARTEIELMTSGPALKEVIDRLKLTYKDIYHPFMSQLTYFWEESWPGRAYYNVKKKLFPDPNAPSEAEIKMGRTITDMKAGISINPVGETYVAKVDVKGPSRRVAEIANTLIDVYLQRRMDRHRSEAQRAYDSLTQQVNQAAEELKTISDRRLEYAMKHNVSFDFLHESLEVKQLNDLETSMADFGSKVAGLAASLQDVEQQLKQEPITNKMATVTELNSVRESAKLKRLEVDAQLIQARNHYREDSPEVQDLLRDKQRLDELIAGESERVEKGSTEGLSLIHQDLISKRDTLEEQLDGQRAGLDAMESKAATLRAKLSVVPAEQSEMRDLERDYSLAQSKYQQLVGKQAEAQVSLATAAAATPSMHVVDYASRPASKWWPKIKLLYPAALLLGLVLGIAAAQVCSVLSGRIHREHIERGPRAVPLYGNLEIDPATRHLVVVRAVTAPRSVLGGSEK